MIDEEFIWNNSLPGALYERGRDHHLIGQLHGDLVRHNLPPLENRFLKTNTHL